MAATLPAVTNLTLNRWSYKLSSGTTWLYTPVTSTLQAAHTEMDNIEKLISLL